MKNEYYHKFLQTVKETKGIHNSLNEILKYDFIYHSNKIEGSTFTTEALQLLFEKNIVMGIHSLDDVQETVNSFYTFDMVLDKIDEKLTLEMIKEWHASLMYRTRLYDMGLAGVFKKYQNRILGAKFDTANPWEVEDKLNELNVEYNKLYNYFGFYDAIQASDYFRKWLIDGFLAFEIVYNEQQTEIIGFVEIDPASLTPGLDPHTN